VFKATRLLLPALLLWIPAIAGAQEAKPDSATVEAATRTLKSDLRNFVTAQERYFYDHNTYARSQAQWATVFTPSRSVTLVLLTSSDTGHSEIAIDERVPGLVCAMYVGNSPPPLGKGSEGEVVCRGP
jgi:hypothetical protein